MNQQAIDHYDSVVSALTEEAREHDGGNLDAARAVVRDYADEQFDDDIEYMVGLFFCSDSDGRHWHQYVGDQPSPPELFAAITKSVLVTDVMDNL